MICIYAESHLCTFTVILYTCIWIPLLQTTQSILRIFTFILNPHEHHLKNIHLKETKACDEMDLRVSRFQDSGIGNRNRADGVNMEEDGEETCSICLMEFENGDFVYILPRCGHMFHVVCMEKWLERCKFTCPLCRSLVFRAISSLPCRNS